MKDGLKSSLKRLERLVQIKQTYVSVAETNVKQAEGEVRQLELADNEVAGNIQHTQAEIAYLQTATGHDIQCGENYIHALEVQRKLIQQSLEKATTNLDQRRGEWTEAMRQEKIIEKVQERRLHQCERDDEVTSQKSQDEISIGRFVRTRKEELRLREIDRTQRDDAHRS
jgi:flagellar export protein FliJ